MPKPDELGDKATEAATAVEAVASEAATAVEAVASEAATAVEAVASKAAEALHRTAVEDAAALMELAAREASGLVTADSLARGQAEIADGIRAARTREFIMMLLFLAFTAAYGLWAFNNTSTAGDAKNAAAQATEAAARAEGAVAQQKLDEARHNKSECINFNVQQQIRRAGNVNLLVEGFRAFVEGPDGAADLERYATGLREIAVRTWPYRDCSEPGIEEYVKNPPLDPALG